MIEVGGYLIGAFDRAGHELMLFAAVGLIVGGLDDVAIDLIWVARSAWRRMTVRRRYPAARADALPPPTRPGRIAIFVPAWDESAVIGQMLRAALDRFDHTDYRIYVGVYPNDPATRIAAQAIGDPRIRIVDGILPGPTSKAECLNRLWAAMLADEAADDVRFKAVVLHDAEDVVHPLELRVFDLLIERFDLIQLPVLPLVDRRSPWAHMISATYVDEFAEAHGKQLVVREALGAGVPSAGVGCALGRQALGRMAEAGGGLPFDAMSVTEDYELGLRLHRFGGRGIFVRIAAGAGKGPVAVRAYFPCTIDAAVRQKTRWLLGIALNGWTRLGWQGGLAESWMRLRDRRAILAAIVLTAAYAAMLLWLVTATLRYIAGDGFAGPTIAPWMMWATTALLGWRMTMRAAMVAGSYGWRQGLASIPRVIAGNMIAIMAAWRALLRYFGTPPGTCPAWDKTAHHFPKSLPVE